MQQMYLEAFARRATAEELAAMTAFLNGQQAYYTLTETNRPWIDLTPRTVQFQGVRVR